MQTDDQLNNFLAGKSEYTLGLFHHFMAKFNEVGVVELHPAKTMIGISNGQKRVAWVTQLGKNFIHVVFPFKQPYQDNLCFQKIARVPGDEQYNHHFRMYNADDVNDELLNFMMLAYNGERSA
ncbi:hypothetical protein IM792_00680 [Mucilaginibacter sp. JRF]|nr:hypothetical protein [Mucilaginibacter sp. JRF]